MKLNELLENIYTKESRAELNRGHIICDLSNVQSLIDMSSQGQTSTVKLTSVFDDKLLNDDFNAVIESFENEEFDAARKKLRSLEKEPCSSNDQMIIQLLKLYADASLWSVSPEERYKTRFEDTYGTVQHSLDELLNEELVEQFKQKAILLIRGM
jgi:hypothetical protein